MKALCLIILLALTQALYGQCPVSLVNDVVSCDEIIETYSVSPGTCQSGHCRYDISFPASWTLLSRTASTATCSVPRVTGGYRIVAFLVYDSINNCSTTIEYTKRYASWTYPTITGTIPTCPVPSQVYIYTAGRERSYGSLFDDETLSWAIAGGTIQSISTSGNILGMQYDTVRVVWSPSGPHRLIATRGGYHSNSYGIYNCQNRDTIWDGGIPPPVISGPAILCGGTTTATYTIPTLDPAFSYSWTCSNGSIASGQGTATAAVNWTGSGTLTLTRTSLGCGWQDSATKNVTISASAPPVPVLPPTIAICPGQNVVLNPGAFSTYHWSNAYITPTIAPTTAGTYSVTVTDAMGCPGTASTTVTNGGAAPVPNLGPNQSGCTGTPITLSPGTFSTYLWSTGATTPTISPSVSGTYSVTVTNANGCTGTDNVTLTFNATPNLGPNQTLCAGTPVTLNPGTFSAYLWSTGATTQTISPNVSGTYSVTVTNASGCPSTDNVTVAFNPLPSFSLGNDTLICADTTLTLNGPSGMNAYAWSNGPTTMANTIATGGTYQLSITDANGCIGSDSITITGLMDCVFPGDANYDGVANNLDVLSIGAYYNTAGPVRPAASTNWYGQSLPDWGGALPGQADPKHSDCNGDGIVLAVDTLAVALNYAKTHNKAAGVSSGDNLYVVPLQDSIAPGDTAWFAIHLGDQNNLADSVYGVAFSVQHSGTGVLQPGIIRVVYANCWFAPAQSRLDFTHNLGAMAGLDLSITRTDQQNQIGFGEVCRIALLTDPSPAGQNVPLTVAFSQSLLVDASLNPIAVLPVPGTLLISTLLNTITGHGVQPRIYPNPADGFVKLELPGAPIDLVEVYDAFGKLQARFQGAGESEMQLSFAGMADGIYLLHIRSNDKVWVAKQVLRK